MSRGRSAAQVWGIAAMVGAVILLVVGTFYGINRGRISADEAAAAEAAITAARSSAAVASEAAEPPVMAFLGDSYGEGTGADDPNSTGMANIIANTMGWQLLNFSEGGTGFLQDGPAAYPERQPFPGRVQKVVDAQPDVVIVAGGINDTAGNWPQDQLTAAITETLSGLQQGLPGVPVVVIGPWWPNGDPVDAVRTTDELVQSVAAQLNMPFVSPIQQDWITGDVDGDDPGNRVDYIGPDNTHPTQAGHEYLAQLVIEFLRTLPDLPAAVAASSSPTG